MELMPVIADSISEYRVNMGYAEPTNTVKKRCEGGCQRILPLESFRQFRDRSGNMRYRNECSWCHEQWKQNRGR